MTPPTHIASKVLPALPGLGKNGEGKNILNCQEAQNSQKG